MRTRPRLRCRTGLALATLTVLVVASVGKCDLPQPKFPTLGAVGAPAHGATASVLRTQ